MDIDPALRVQLDRAAVHALPQIRTVIRRVVREPSLVEELVQETILQAYRSASSFAGNASMVTWICGIARYVALGAVRRRGEVLTVDGLLDDADDTSRSTLQALTREEREDLVRQAATSCLDAVDQEIFRLRFEEGLEYKAIEERLSLQTESGARGALVRIKRRMERELSRRLIELGHGDSFLHTEVR